MSSPNGLLLARDTTSRASKNGCGFRSKAAPTNRFQVLLLRSQTVCQIISEQLFVFVTEMKKLARL